MKLIFTLLSAKMKSRLDGGKKLRIGKQREALVPLDRLLKPLCPCTAAVQPGSGLICQEETCCSFETLRGQTRKRQKSRIDTGHFVTKLSGLHANVQQCNLV